ncbi:MAG: hypothetical protein ACYC3X_23840 [Pirellulaceae bacterium]
MLSSFPQQTLHVSSGQTLADAVVWIDGRVPRLVRWEGPTEVRLLHRQEPGRDLLLVANPSPRVAEGRLTAPDKGTASVWDPETGDVLVIGPTEKQVAIPLTIPAESARVLVVEK